MKRLVYILIMCGLMASCRPGQAQQQVTGAFRNDASSPSAEAQTGSLLQQRVPDGTPEIMLTRTGYVTSYNQQTRTPNWVAWTLTREHTRGDVLRENERFEEDTDVPEPRATYQDYYNSRYDRGHMCPAGDNKWSQQAMTESFLMTNICPQNHGLNKDDWNDLEMQCRTWARRYGELTIVCGPLFEYPSPSGRGGEGASSGGAPSSGARDGAPRTIGRNRVQVPTGFFKVVYRAQPEPAAVAFIFRNDGSSQPWRQQVCTVDEVERRSGIDFFPQLPADVERTVEAQDGLSGW